MNNEVKPSAQTVLGKCAGDVVLELKGRAGFEAL
jgi:hypothetical protein